MIKYIGSKRALVPVLGVVADAVGARTAVDLFTGSTRVAQEFKRRGLQVTACDLASYSAVLGDCYVSTDAADVDSDELDAIISELNALRPRRGYFTRTFCEDSRFFQPKNGARIDAIRNHLEANYRDHPLFPVLLTSLLLAADRVDSTAGVQMAYLKQWAPRAANDLALRVPELIDGRGTTLCGDAMQLVGGIDHVDLMYLDPPYNQHRYFTNYHVWETLVRWDQPEHYGIACKRLDARDDSTRSVFNSRRDMPTALADLFARARADLLVVSYNNESWVSADQMVTMLRDAGHESVQQVAFEHRRYVGARIGIFNPAGVKVGTVSHTRNTEYLFLAGDRDRVEAAAQAAVEPTVPTAQAVAAG